MKTTARLILAALAFVTVAGCLNLPKEIEKLDALGIRELHIPGRHTTTRYTTEDKDGKRTSTLTHTNPLLVEPAKLVRERPIPAIEAAK